MQKPRMRKQRVGGIEYWKCWMPIGDVTVLARGETPDDTWRRFCQELADHIDPHRWPSPLERLINWLSR